MTAVGAPGFLIRTAPADAGPAVATARSPARSRVEPRTVSNHRVELGDGPAPRAPFDVISTPEPLEMPDRRGSPRCTVPRLRKVYAVVTIPTSGGGGPGDRLLRPQRLAAPRDGVRIASVRSDSAQDGSDGWIRLRRPRQDSNLRRTV